MPVPSQPLPTIGQPNSTEDAKVASALSELQTILTGRVDSSNLAVGAALANLAAASITSDKWKPTSAVVNTPASTTTIPGSTLVDVAGLSLTLTAAIPSIFLVWTWLDLKGRPSAETADGTAWTQLVVNGTVDTQSGLVGTGGGGFPGFNGTASIMTRVSLPAGTHTFKVQAFASGSITPIQYRWGQLMVLQHAA